MLKKFSNSRTFSDNVVLGVLTAFVAGMVNIGSLLLFFAFTSNITGHYAILAAEIVKGNYHQVIAVLSWIFLFFFGSFSANFLIINFSKRNPYLAHAVPIVLEILLLITVGFYGEYYYKETLQETELLVALMLFAMGLQNGLTASISNFAVKTTHLTGLTTDLGILFSLFTQEKYRKNQELVNKAKLLLSIAAAYLVGAVSSGFVYYALNFRLFYVVSVFLIGVIVYDFYKIKFLRSAQLTRLRKTNARSWVNLPKLSEVKQNKENEIPAY